MNIAALHAMKGIGNMTKYHTKDGHEIVRDGVYSNTKGEKFVCLGFKSDGQDCPVVGYRRYSDGTEKNDAYDPNGLTLWREPAAPETVEVWEVVTMDFDEVFYFRFNNEKDARYFAKGRDNLLTIRHKETITVGGV